MKKEIEEKCTLYRESLKPIWDGFDWKETPKFEKQERPIFFKQYESDAIIDLSSELLSIEKHTLMDTIQARRSIRKYEDKSITFEEFSYLIQNTCKTIKISEDKALSLGVIPTPGAIKSIETYIYVHNVENMEKGIYHYNLVDNKLYLINNDVTQEDIEKALRSQTKNYQIAIFWTTSPARTEYKYSYLSHKMIGMEAGHTCQNLYLCCTCLDLGMVAIGAYSQEYSDKLLEIDGVDEFTIYAATIGRPKIT